MKDIEMKELLCEWKTVLGSTASFIWKWIVIISKFIWKKTVAFSKWLWSEIVRFQRGATWITLVLISALIGVVGAGIMFKSDYNRTITSYITQIDSMNLYVDSIEVDNKTGQLMRKAGKYAMIAHHETIEISKDSAASLLKSVDAWYPDIILAQIQVESGYGTSNVAMHSNNVLGMKKTNSRKTTQIKNDDYNGYGKYTNWESCIIDRVMWDYEFFGAKKPSREKYIEVLNKFYGGHGHYGDTMNQIGKSFLKYL